MEPVLITRGTGFIGSHTCKGFTAAGFLSVTTRRRISSRLPSTLRPEMAHFGTDYHSQQQSRGSRGWPSRAGSLERCRSRTVLSEAHPAYVIGTGRRPRHGLASLALQRLAPGEGFRPTQVKGNVLGGALRPIPGAAEGTRYQVAPCLADGEETGHHLRTRRVVDAAGIVLRHHEFAERSAEAVHHPGHLHAPAFGIV